MEEYITLNQLLKSNKFSWIRSIQTLKKWVIRDIQTDNILETKIINSLKGSTGVRYLIPSKNISKFLTKFTDKNYNVKTKRTK